MSLIQTQGNRFKSAYKGSRTELPTSTFDGLFVPNCTANLSLWKKWLILRLLKRACYQLKLYCNRALAVKRLRSDFSQPLFKPSTEVLELVLEVTWSALTAVEKLGAHRREQRWAEMPSGRVCVLLHG